MDQQKSPVKSGVLRWLLLAAGVAATALAMVGAFLPVLPTTPFLILAAACFARSSPAFHRWLLSNRMFGPYLTQWQRDHTIPRDAKRKAYTVIALSFGLSLILIDVNWVRVVLLVVLALLVILLARMPTTPNPPKA